MPPQMPRMRGTLILGRSRKFCGHRQGGKGCFGGRKAAALWRAAAMVRGDADVTVGTAPPELAACCARALAEQGACMPLESLARAAPRPTLATWIDILSRKAGAM